MVDVTTIDLIKLVISRGFIFFIGFSAGCFTMIGIWLLYKVVPKVNTYVMLIDSAHRWLKHDKDSAEFKKETKERFVDILKNIGIAAILLFMLVMVTTIAIVVILKYVFSLI